MLHVLKFGSAPFNIMIEPSETKVLLIYEEMHQAEADPYIHFRCFSLIITSLRAELFI